MEINETYAVLYIVDRNPDISREKLIKKAYNLNKKLGDTSFIINVNAALKNCYGAGFIKESENKYNITESGKITLDVKSKLISGNERGKSQLEQLAGIRE